jgi:hypothetical protein
MVASGEGNRYANIHWRMSQAVSVYYCLTPDRFSPSPLAGAIEKNRMRPPIPPPEDLDDSAVVRMRAWVSPPLAFDDVPSLKP